MDEGELGANVDGGDGADDQEGRKKETETQGKEITHRG